MANSALKYFESISGTHRAGQPVGLYSVCCATPLVVEAACEQARDDNAVLLIEATANQVNQFGGYTGMTPKDFIQFVSEIAHKVGLSTDWVMFGGDHLGPVCWTNETHQSAMEKAEQLVADYARAGFRKIHLDCSMPCADDPDNLCNEEVAARAVRLAQAAEGASQGIHYVIGTEVPPPGGATSTHQMVPTSGTGAVATWEAHRRAFMAAGMEQPWSRVTALVVQPGVEFGNLTVDHYRGENRTELLEAAGRAGIPLFEAHSTDYQSHAALRALVQDGFGILKVGPQLTFAFREALIALSHIEDWLVAPSDRSNLRQVCEKIMTDRPNHWQKYYSGDLNFLKIQRFFSYSDRIRYYWPDSELIKSVEKLFHNLNKIPIPDTLLSQYLPIQYASIRDKNFRVDAQGLVKAKIRDVLSAYAKACHEQT